MKFYVASTLSDREQVQDLHQEIINRGHAIAYDWTSQNDNKPYIDHPESANIVATETIEAIKDIDVLILLTKSEGGRGMYITLGATLLSWLSNKNIRIFAVGPNNDNSVFYFHQAVTRVETVQDIWQIIE